MALEVLKTAAGKLDAAQGRDGRGVEDGRGRDRRPTPAERARLELARDEKLRALQNEERRYQIAKDLSDNLTVGYNTSEVIMARLMQTTSAKERVYQQSVSFFSTNESVLTALSASFTGLHGLHESTQTLNTMKEGVSQSLETLSEIGGKVQEEALKAGYRPDHPRRCGEEAGGLGRQLPGALARDHRGDAHAEHEERERDPRRGRGRQAAHGPAGREGAELVLTTQS